MIRFAGIVPTSKPSLLYCSNLTCQTFVYHLLWSWVFLKRINTRYRGWNIVVGLGCWQLHSHSIRQRMVYAPCAGLILHHLRTSVYPNTFTSLPIQNASFSKQFSFLKPKSLNRKIISQNAVLSRSTDDPHGVHFPRRDSITSDACHGRNSTAVFIHTWNASLRFYVSAFYNSLIIYLSPICSRVHFNS
jgi:hypothetical protein